MILALIAACAPDPDVTGDSPGTPFIATDVFRVPEAPADVVRVGDPAIIGLDEEQGWLAGQSSFISADGQWASWYGGGWGLPFGPDGGAASASPYGEGDGRSVEQGDIYASLDERTLLNLNQYRGLQVVDLSDLQHPRVISRVPFAGVPMELYVLDDNAIVLLNGWQAYAGSPDDMMTDPVQGGVVLVIDMSDRLAPRVTARELVPGVIAQSRLTCGDEDQSLYVAATTMTEAYVYETRLLSFSITADGSLEPRSDLTVDGTMTVIQATPEAMLVARPDSTGQRSRVLVVDISDPKGTMVERADVTLSGYVANHSNLDFRGGVLRAASSSWTGGTVENHLETFGEGDGTLPVEQIDHVTFGAGENLFATLFLAHSAFAVTYLRVDPFHAFELTPEGVITERSQFVVSGWNDFFRAALDETRIIGVGIDDADGSRRLALSLYDITDLDSEAPLVDRESLPSNITWTPAQNDHRAFAVLEDAVEVVEGGRLETGLLMLPVAGYDPEAGGTFSGTQLFTFSAGSLTPRGFVRSAGQVQRAFPVEGATASLSDYELTLFDATDPGAPAALGRAVLSPNYLAVEAFGDTLARVESRSQLYGWDPSGQPPSIEVQVIPTEGDPDLAEPLATFEVPANAQLVRVGDAFVALTAEYAQGPDGTYAYETGMEVWDLSDPEEPRRRGSLQTDRLEPFQWGGYYGGGSGSYYDNYGSYDYCYGAYPSDYYGAYGCGSTPVAEAYGVGENAAVFVRHLPQNRVVGREESCVSYARNPAYNCPPGSDCRVFTGYVQCTRLDDQPELCTNALQECAVLADGAWECTPVPDDALDDVPLEEHCNEYDRTRYWESYEIDVLDLSDLDRPVLRSTLVMPTDEESTGVYVQGSSLYVISRVPVRVEGDPRPFVRYYFRAFDLRRPRSIDVSAAINVPGEVIRVDGDTLYTRDFVWGEEVIEPAVNRLDLSSTRAYLRARRVFDGEEAYRVTLDGDGRMLVSHRLAWAIASQAPDFDGANWLPVLSVLDAEGDLGIVSELELETWMTFHDAHAGRALLAVPGGLLVLDVATPGEPAAVSFFPGLGVLRRPIFEDRTLTFAAGLYGVYRLDLDAFNLVDR